MDSYLVPLIASACIVAASALLLKCCRKEEVLSKDEYRKFPLQEKIQISPNTALYRFTLPKKTSKLSLPVGKHISVKAMIDGKSYARNYTPTSLQDTQGHFDLVIKSYPTGNVSKMFGELKIGDTVNVSGPKGTFFYQPGMAKHVGMIAGGTGITPMLQIARAIITNPDDNTRISLIFANVNYEDILLKEELEQMARDHKNFSVFFVLNNVILCINRQPPEKWDGGVGFVSEEMIKEHLPQPSADIRILLCGPPPMTKAMAACCENLGYDKPRAASKRDDMVFKF